MNYGNKYPTAKTRSVFIWHTADNVLEGWQSPLEQLFHKKEFAFGLRYVVYYGNPDKYTKQAYYRFAEAPTKSYATSRKVDFVALSVLFKRTKNEKEFGIQAELFLLHKKAWQKPCFYDIIVSRYLDIILRRSILRKVQKDERTKQVQFRMTKELHLALRKALLDDGVSMADFFNKAAEKYIKKHKEKETTESENNG